MRKAHERVMRHEGGISDDPRLTPAERVENTERNVEAMAAQGHADALAGDGSFLTTLGFDLQSVEALAYAQAYRAARL